MKIGIDIDGVLNSQYNFCIDYGTKFCNEIGKYKLENVNAIDTTGAGDTYIGYFVKGILEGFSLVESANLATKASAIAVTRFGAVDSIPSYDEVK